MTRPRDQWKISVDLGPELHRQFESWRVGKGVPRAVALREIVERFIQEQMPGEVARAPERAADMPSSNRLRVRVVPKPVDDRERARSLSANPLTNADAIADQEPADADSRTTEARQLEEFLQSPVTHALLSAWMCSRCGIPVDPKWTHCPVCGGDEMKKRDIGDYPGFDEVVERWGSARELVRP